jgi:two-component system, LytTR family, response regulator
MRIWIPKALLSIIWNQEQNIHKSFSSPSQHSQVAKACGRVRYESRIRQFQCGELRCQPADASGTSPASGNFDAANFGAKRFVLWSVNCHMNRFPELANRSPELWTMLPTIRTLIADMDSEARARLRVLLACEAGVNVVAECVTGSQIIAAVETHKPDLLFLDLDLSDFSAFQLLNQIPCETRPILIFTSTHDRYVLQAFEARALDYLLKPLQADRLHVAIERTRAELIEIQHRQLTNRLLGLLALTRSESPSDRRLVVKSGGRVIFLNMREIDWIKAAGNYVRVNVQGDSYLLREGIGRVAERLDPKQFVRIHRSIIVNLEKIKELHPCNRGEYMVILRDGKELSCSRGYRSRLQQLIS